MGAVPYIRPITDLKKTNEISTFCREVKQPVFITKNGHSDMVIMSTETYEREMALIEVIRKLAIAEEEIKAGASGSSHEEVMLRMRKKVSEKV